MDPLWAISYGSYDMANLPTTVHLAQIDGPGEFFICRSSDDKEVISKIYFKFSQF